MKLLIQFLITLVLSYFVGLFFPFWTLAIVAFVIAALTNNNVWSSFIAGFLAILVLWAVQAYLIDNETNSILTDKVAQIFSVNSLALIFITAVIGGLLGGFSAVTGSLFRNLFASKPNPYT